MRELTLALIAIALATPALAQDTPALVAPKTKRVCKWIETGNPLDNKRVCREIALSQPAASPAAAPDQPAPAQVAMQAEPPHR